MQPTFQKTTYHWSSFGAVSKTKHVINKKSVEMPPFPTVHLCVPGYLPVPQAPQTPKENECRSTYEQLPLIQPGSKEIGKNLK